MKEKTKLLDEMDEALEAANRCSEALEQLLKEAKKIGTPSPELVERISAMNMQCDEAMKRYIMAYRNYYNVGVKE